MQQKNNVATQKDSAKLQLLLPCLAWLHFVRDCGLEEDLMVHLQPLLGFPVQELPLLVMAVRLSHVLYNCCVPRTLMYMTIGTKLIDDWTPGHFFLSLYGCFFINFLSLEPRGLKTLILFFYQPSVCNFIVWCFIFLQI